MPTKRSQRLHIELDIRSMGDQALLDLVTGILVLAKDSPLCAKVQGIQDGVVALGKLGEDLATWNGTVSQDEAQLAADMSVRDEVRVELQKAVVTLKALVENNAKNAGDIAGMAFKQRGPRPPRPPLEPPESIDVKVGNVHGRFRVSAHQTGKTRRSYAVEVSVYGTDVWTPIYGNGKSRTITGFASGTRVWVRYALTRGQAQSAWGTPVLVTVP